MRKRYWFIVLHYRKIWYKKCKNLQPVINIIEVFDLYRDKGDDEVYENSTIDVEVSFNLQKRYTDEFFKHKCINSNRLQKIDEIVKESDVVEILDCYGWKGNELT